MKQSIHTDIQNIRQIQKYIADLKTIMSGIDTWESLRDSMCEKYAVTQIITNICECDKNLQSDAPVQLPDMRRVRNINSHNYMGVDFKITFNVCQSLIREDMTKCLKESLKQLKNTLASLS